MQKAWREIRRESGVLVGVFFVALILGGLWVMLVKWFSGLFVYVTLIGGLVLIVASGGFLYSHAEEMKHEYLRVVAIGLFILAAVIFCLIIFLRKKIALTVALLKVTPSIDYNLIVVILGDWKGDSGEFRASSSLSWLIALLHPLLNLLDRREYVSL